MPTIQVFVSPDDDETIRKYMLKHNISSKADAINHMIKTNNEE